MAYSITLKTDPVTREARRVRLVFRSEAFKDGCRAAEVARDLCPPAPMSDGTRIPVFEQAFRRREVEVQIGIPIDAVDAEFIASARAHLRALLDIAEARGRAACTHR